MFLFFKYISPDLNLKRSTNLLHSKINSVRIYFFYNQFRNAIEWDSLTFFKYFRYDIINYQKTLNETYEYVKIGEWKNGTLNLTENIFQSREIISVCSHPCQPGFYRVSYYLHQIKIL